MWHCLSGTLVLMTTVFLELGFSAVPTIPPPPPHTEKAKTARYMAHYSNWGFLSTISTQENIKGLPFGNVFSVSDGPWDNSTGVPFFYMTPLDNSVMDLISFPFASLTFSEAQGDFCRRMGYDPADGRCARLTLTGKITMVPSHEYFFAKNAMFSRHPNMTQWPEQHQFMFMKMEIQQVWLQNWFGYVSPIPLVEYFLASP